MLGGTANLTRNAADFPGSLRQILEALEEQVVVFKLLGVRAGPGHGHRAHRRARTRPRRCATRRWCRSATAAGTVLGGMGVVGPTRMDYPGTIAAVHAVARYVGEILGWHASEVEREIMRDARRGHGLLRDPRRRTGRQRPTRSSGRTGGWRASCTRTSTRTPEAQERFSEVNAAYEVLSDPQKRQIVDLGGDPLGNGGRGAGGDPFGALRLRRHHGRLLRRSRRRGAASRGRAAACSPAPTRSSA